MFPFSMSIEWADYIHFLICSDKSKNKWTIFSNTNSWWHKSLILQHCVRSNIIPFSCQKIYWRNFGHFGRENSKEKNVGVTSPMGQEVLPDFNLKVDGFGKNPRNKGYRICVCVQNRKTWFTSAKTSSSWMQNGEIMRSRHEIPAFFIPISSRSKSSEMSDTSLCSLCKV